MIEIELALRGLWIFLFALAFILTFQNWSK